MILKARPKLTSLIFFIFILFFIILYATGFALPSYDLSEDIPRPEYPRPEKARAEWVNLNGWWDFAVDYSESGEEKEYFKGKGFDQRILVPFAPESPLSGIGNLDFMKVVWYKRTFRVPEAWRRKRILLHFEACDYRTTVWVNRKKAGEHEGGYTPFSLDITDLLTASDNLLVVRAYDDVRSRLQPTGKQSHRLHSYSCLYRRTTGIWQTVWLEPVPDIHIEDYRVFPDVDNGEARIVVHMNRSPAEGEITLLVKAAGKEEHSIRKKADPAVSFLVKFKKPKLWDIRQPHLYGLDIVYAHQGKEIDRIQGYFGLRKVEARGKTIYLNNRPVFLRLVLDQGFYPDGIYTAPTEEVLKQDIEISLGLGFDGARLHQRVFERRFLYWADRLGYIVWGEYADWGLDISRPESFFVFAREWAEAVERDLNHPSLIGWCPFNEKWEDEFPGLIEGIYRLTKRLDPTRLVIDASGGYHCVSPDVYDSHNYEQDIARFKAAFDGLLQEPPVVFVNGERSRHVTYAGQPYFVSEYGGIWWNPGQKDDKAWGYGARPKSEEEFLERYKKLTEALLFNAAVAGFCYTQLYDIEQEVNGLYTFDRKPKFDPAIFFRINQQKAAIER
ncbi:MAG: glycoside hydrolase family 2 TIM barrel-domain containing protein [Clostridiales bacterium]|nr:glycoside hydrolase family 2 TIM barrel-domain containing protein [Clostridiales bacterium]